MILTATEEFLQEVLDFNHRRFSYTSDRKQFDVGDYWNELVPDEGHFEGDCDDFAIACRNRIANLRPELNPRLLDCFTETGGRHLVCYADGWVLDNRHKMIQDWTKLGYRWVRISGINPGDPWRSITA